jgi:phage repressor protein C with HTH and peptisase S24 domain
MMPNFKPNDYVLCIKYLPIKVNDVVIVNSKDHGKIIKRIKSIKENSINIFGDNLSYESDTYSHSYNKKDILGKVIFKLPL